MMMIIVILLLLLLLLIIIIIIIVVVFGKQGKMLYFTLKTLFVLEIIKLSLFR